MSNQTKAEEFVGCKRPPKSGQSKRVNPATQAAPERKPVPSNWIWISFFNEVFTVRVAGQIREMSAKEVEIRQILKKAIDTQDLSIAYLLDCFEKQGCVAQAENRQCGVITLPTNSMPFRMALLILEQYGLPKHWTKRQIAWGRKQ